MLQTSGEHLHTLYPMNDIHNGKKDTEQIHTSTLQ